MDTKSYCPCGKLFPYHYLLMRHQNGTRGCSYTKSLKDADIEEPSICNKCYKKLSNKYNLARHNKICKATKSIPDNPKYLDTNMDILDTMLDEINKLKNNKKIDVSSIKQLYNLLNSISDNTQPNTQPINQNPIIFKPNTDIDIEKLININEHGTANIECPQTNTTNNNTNNNNCNNTTNTTNITNNTTNITNNNSPTIHPIIYPFGYENLSFLSNREMLNILTSPTCLNDALELIFSRQEHKSYFKRNLNRNQVSVINKNYNTKVYSDREFKNEMIKNLILAIQRMFYTCKHELDFDEQLVLWQHIKLLNKTYTESLTVKNEKNLPSNVKNIMNTICNLVLSDKETTKVCEDFNMFKHKMLNDPKYKETLLKLLQSIIIELENYNNDLDNITVSDETLKETWTTPPTNIELHNNNNNVKDTEYKKTDRYKYFNDMTNLENQQLNNETQSIGNINEVINIRLERMEHEINTLKTHFILTQNQVNKIRRDIIIEPINNNSKHVAQIRENI